MDWQNITLFVATAGIMILTPGPDIIYVSTRGMAQGRYIALVSTLGICTGYVIHSMFAAFGLSAILEASSTAFQVTRYAGAAYLIYLGAKMLISKKRLITDEQAAQVRITTIYRQGVTTSILNPKGVLFFVAFLPQFVNPASAFATWQFFAFGLLFTLMCMVIYGIIGYIAGKAGDRLNQTPQLARIMQNIAGWVMIGLGMRIALPQRR